MAGILRDYEAQYRAGDLMAIDKALSACAAAVCPPPKWVRLAVFELIGAAIVNRKVPGRRGSYDAALRQAMTHHVRWASVRSLYDADKTRAWKDAFALASKELRSTPAKGSKHTMRESYKKVQRRDPRCEDNLGETKEQTKQRRSNAAQFAFANRHELLKRWGRK